MKTPRELLLQKNRSITPRLDAIRSNVLKHELPDEATKAASEERGSLLRLLWEQLVLPAPRIWGGLAAIWMGVLVLNVAGPRDPELNYAASNPPENTEQRQMALEEQRRLLAELLHGNGRSHASAQPYVPRPSSRRSTAAVRLA